MADYEVARRLDPQDKRLGSHRAQMLWQLHRWEDTPTELEHAARRQTGDWELSAMPAPRSVAREALPNDAEARDWFDRSVGWMAAHRQDSAGLARLRDEAERVYREGR